MRQSAPKDPKATPKLRVTVNAPAPEMPLRETSRHTLNADLRHRMISETACYLHVKRENCGGYDMDDWMQAEARIDHRVLGVRSADGINASVLYVLSAKSQP